MSAPTKDPNAYLAREIDLLAQDFHSLGEQNRAIAREEVSAYRARRLDEIQFANHMQMLNAVKGGDRYEFHRRSFLRSPLGVTMIVLAVLLIGYAIVRSI